ncbi:MAG TPA: hypothetical protein VEJ21_04385, partial [Acidimicrobiales bacterium]|nr:hypothetical protein [Acidimicrobiales bacterium]
PRVNLEATLIRLAHPEADDSNAAILERLERLERAVREGVAPGAAASGGSPATASAAPPRAPAAPAATDATGDEPPGEKPAGEDAPGRGAAPGPVLARQSLGALRKQARAERSAASSPHAATQSAARPPTAPASTVAPATDPPSPTGEPASPTPGRAAPPSRDALVEAWGDGLLTRLPPRARARFRVGRFVDTEDATAVFALPNDTHRSYCEEVRLEVEQLLSAHFATPVRLRLVVDEESDPTAGRGGAAVVAPASPGEDPAVDDSALLDPEVLEAETEPAGAGLSPEQRLKEMFPGAEEV